MKSYVFITGATGGLGRAFVLEAAGRGWDLFITDVPGAPLRVFAEEVSKRYGVEIQYLECDFLNQDKRDEFFSRLNKTDLKFHFLINVAGIEFENPFVSQSLENIRQILNVNINGTIELTHQLLRRRGEGDTFRILTVSSLSCFFPMPNKAAYSSTKSFLYHFFTSLREELRGENVSVTILCPSCMPTNDVARKRIEAQGLFGKLTSIEPDLLAQQSIDKVLEGVEEFIPGFINRLLRFIGSFLREPVKARILKKRWNIIKEYKVAIQNHNL